MRKIERLRITTNNKEYKIYHLSDIYLDRCEGLISKYCRFCNHRQNRCPMFRRFVRKNWKYYRKTQYKVRRIEMARHERIQVFKCKDCGTYFETEVKLDAVCEKCLSKNVEAVETYDDFE